MTSNIAYFRRKQKLTQKDLAEKLGIKRYRFSLIENKIIIPSSNIAEKTSSILKKDIGELWTEAEINLMFERNNK